MKLCSRKTENSHKCFITEAVIHPSELGNKQKLHVPKLKTNEKLILFSTNSTESSNETEKANWLT